MKKVLITLTLLLTLGMTTEMVAQKHRHTPQAKELVDSTSKDAVEVYSDTTSASTTVADTDNDDDWTRDDDQYPATIMDHMLDKAAEGSSEIAGMFFVLAVVLIIFVVGMVIHWLPERFKRRYRVVFSRLPLGWMAALVVFLILFIYQFITADLQSFIYFQF